METGYGILFLLKVAENVVKFASVACAYPVESRVLFAEEVHAGVSRAVRLCMVLGNPDGGGAEADLGHDVEFLSKLFLIGTHRQVFVDVCLFLLGTYAEQNAGHTFHNFLSFC